MTSNLQFLKPNLVIEPLYDRWYAWAHLLAPATAAMNIVNRHLKIMNSYIQAPQMHEAAVKNPAMRGGPFMDFTERRVAEVKRLRDHTLQEQAHMIAFAQAIKQLDVLLLTSDGHSLELLYEQVPDLLKGYVELVYDLNNHASFRFFEPLLYESPYYNPSSESIALWLTMNDERPFCLSTPRLDEDNVMHLDIPFSSGVIDELSTMKYKPGSVEKISRRIGIQEKDQALFASFFTDTAPPPYKKYDGSRIRMRYFGHACILVETRSTSILIDPLISYYGYPSEVAHFSDIDLPETIDYVLITHNHQDHILFETLLPLRHKIKHLVVPRSRSGFLQDPNLKFIFERAGFKNVIELDELDVVKSSDCTITGLPFTGEHADLNIRTKLCYHVAIDGFKLLFAADSRVMEPALYQHLHRIMGDVDVLLLGMECDGAPLSWLYGPLLTTDLSRSKDSSRRLSGSDYEKGMQLVKIFNPVEVYVYAMGQEPWVEFISSIKYTPESNPIIQSDKLLRSCAEANIKAERLFGEKELLYSTKRNPSLSHQQ